MTARNTQPLTVGAVYEATDAKFGTFTYLVLREDPQWPAMRAWRVLMLDGGYPLGEAGRLALVGQHMWAFSLAKRIA